PGQDEQPCQRIRPARLVAKGVGGREAAAACGWTPGSCATAGDGVVDDEDAVAVAVVAGTTVVRTHTVVAGRRGVTPRSVGAGAECGLEALVARVSDRDGRIGGRATREMS